MDFNLCKLFSLQRSGNHAVINWLIGLNQESTLFFHQLKPGLDLLENDSGVSLPEGTHAYVKRVNKQKIYWPQCVEWFNERGGRLLLSYESYRVSEFNEKMLDKPVEERFGKPENKINILVLRNPFNMLPSFEKLRRREMEAKGQDEKWIIHKLNWQVEMWKSYAFLYLNPSVTRGEFVVVNFDRWVAEKAYRDLLANQLGYVNKDRFIDFVSDAGGGSSFDNKRLNRQEDVLNRWESASNCLKKIVIKDYELIDYSAIIFGEGNIPRECLN